MEAAMDKEALVEELIASEELSAEASETKSQSLSEEEAAISEEEESNAKTIDGFLDIVGKNPALE